jgi:hypothetical protein
VTPLKDRIMDLSDAGKVLAVLSLRDMGEG